MLYFYNKNFVMLACNIKNNFVKLFPQFHSLSTTFIQITTHRKMAKNSAKSSDSKSKLWDSKHWNRSDIPELTGKNAIVTGGTGGLGYETALSLAVAGANVIVAARNEAKGQEALGKIKVACPNAKVIFGLLDLGNLASVAEFTRIYNAKDQSLDILVNNAGIMAPKKRQTTSDGFEIQFGTNHLSHFALTAQLLPSLRRSYAPRVVNVSSGAARNGKIRFEDLMWEKKYSDLGSYAQSKLANLLFTFELQRRSVEHGWNISAIGAHPGFSRTDLISNGPGDDAWFIRLASKTITPLFMQSAVDGALPLLYAAAAADASPAGYYGPNGFYELKGQVAPAHIPPEAKNLQTAKKLWDLSEQLTKVKFE